MSDNNIATQRIVKNAIDLDFTIVAELHPNGIVASFTIYDIACFSEGGTPGVYNVPEWTRKGSDDSMNSTSVIEEAEIYLHGCVKWDGCSDWHFDEQDRCMLHGCTRGDIQRFGDVMALCWDWAKELIGERWLE